MANLDKRILFFVGLFLTISLSGCSDKPLLLLVANKNIEMYETHIKEDLKEYKLIKPGEVCIPGDTKMEKMFEYTEVLCSSAGYGWVIDAQHFTKVKPEKWDSKNTIKNDQTRFFPNQKTGAK